MSYFESGFTVIQSKDVLKRINGINNLLASLLGLRSESSTFFEEVHGKFLELFCDKDLYTGFLKAFTNSPIVQDISSSPDLLREVANCGVNIPSLVTPPILHVVANDLIINRDKVFTPFHQDVVSTKGSVGQVVIWIPLHDINPDNFGINAISGSHKLGILETDPSDFGHTVKSKLVESFSSEYISLEKGEFIIFSQYLVHHTHKIGNFRMALSFRFNDMSDPIWKRRKYFVPFERSQIDREFPDNRDRAPDDVNEYFSRK